MFSLKKDKEKPELKKEPVEVFSKISKEIWAKIHVMPQRFYIAPQRSRFKLIILFSLIIFLLAGIIIIAVIFNFYLKKEQLPLANQPVNLNTPSFNTNNTNNTNFETNQNFNKNVNFNINGNANFNANLNTNSAIPTPLPNEVDLDRDGLTTIEETFFGTDPAVADTDSDGYLDGSELINGYNPVEAGTSLAESDLVEIYQDSEKGYSVWYPKTWSLNILTSPERQVLFTSLTGESFIILFKDNPDNLSLSEWYQRQFPQISLELIEAVRFNNLVGLIHPDKLSYYLAAPDNLGRIYLLSYNYGARNKLNFATTFSFFVNSFKLPL